MEGNVKIPIRHKLFWAVLIAGSVSLLVAATSGGTSPNGAGNAAQAASASQPKVDLNSASESELEELPGIGPASAKKIIAARPFSSVSDLSKTGIPASTISKISPLVTAGTAGAAASDTNAASTAASAVGSSAKQAAATAQSAATGQAPPANSQGMVWVNLDSGVYHYPNSRYYGKTKNGKYMSESHALGAGYHAAANEKKPQ